MAAIAARKLRAKHLAMVVGRTIHLFNTSREEFMRNEKWLCHELVHVEQTARYGTLRFLFLYLVESIRRGYRANRFEVEARNREGDEKILLDYIIS